MAQDRWNERGYDRSRDHGRGGARSRYEYGGRRDPRYGEDPSFGRGDYGPAAASGYGAPSWDQGFGQGGYGGGHGGYGEPDYGSRDRRQEDRRSERRYGRPDRGGYGAWDPSRSAQPDYDERAYGPYDAGPFERGPHDRYGRGGPGRSEGQYHGQDYERRGPGGPYGQGGYRSHGSYGPGGYADLGRGAWEAPRGQDYRARAYPGPDPDRQRRYHGQHPGQYHGQDLGPDHGGRYEQGGWGRDQYGRAGAQERRDRERAWPDFDFDRDPLSGR
jgi:hypothetical protein